MPTPNELILTLAGHLRSTAAILEQLAAAPVEEPEQPEEPAPVEPEPTPEPAPEPEPEPVVPAPPPPPIWTTLAGPRLTIPASVEVPAGQREIFIPVMADTCERQSFYAYVNNLKNAPASPDFTMINVGNSAQQQRMFQFAGQVYTWFPGDDLTHYVRLVADRDWQDGARLVVAIRAKGLGHQQTGREVTVTFRAGAAHPDMPPQHHRPRRRLDLSQAQRKGEFTPANLQWSDSGFDANGRPVLRSRLSHGRSQKGNNETGYYCDRTVVGLGASQPQNPISYDADEGAIRLHTLAFPDGEPLRVMEGEVEVGYRHQAVMLQAQTVDALCGTEGVWRFVGKVPTRRYSWPAFWLVGRGSRGHLGGSSGWTAWPPEIDVFEGFNGIYSGSDTVFTSTFAQHFGPHGSNNRLGAFGGEFEANAWTGSGPLHEGYHSWACVVEYDEQDTRKSRVAFFFDDVEVGCHTLFARHEDMTTKAVLYPMANVAVKAPASHTAAQYNGSPLPGDMLLRDMAHYPTGYRMVSE